MERFKGISPHRPLDEGATKIRIVNLLPGEFGDPIECILEHIDMEDTKDYEAISYCWGESSITKPILLESKPYPVTTNLFDGLQRLRRSEGPRKLWIDSLCINQSDVAERSREIQKMWSIYKSSAGVVVWLGECLPWSETTVQAIADFIIDIGQAWNPERLDHSGVVARYGYNELWRQHLRMNEFLRQRQWFERTWVIQEIAAKSPFNNSELCPTMLCGTIRLSFHYLQRANAFWTTMPSEYDSLTILRIYNPLYIQLEMCGEYRFFERRIQETKSTEYWDCSNTGLCLLV
ncbi:heterokaryon incompatibility protein-domain-containing protein [Apiospora kogelbergensis]|uniref:heterokaryon incompatibility protein-domain-containing protein n=1 Tax=Apiospora kogelbergensis TaxID=1337665 RepID=UPI00312E985D